MTRDEIIKMAREAGLAALLRDTQKTHEALERFAALVAAAEREACYQIALTIGDADAGCRHTDEVARRIRARGNT